jgi:hypothetical protein
MPVFSVIALMPSEAANQYTSIFFFDNVHTDIHHPFKRTI